jgi:hypothetical protein
MVRRQTVAGSRDLTFHEELDEVTGLSRKIVVVVELFEARKPLEAAMVSEIDGAVRHSGVFKGQPKIIVVPSACGCGERAARVERVGAARTVLRRGRLL